MPFPTVVIRNEFFFYSKYIVWNNHKLTSMIINSDNDVLKQQAVKATTNILHIIGIKIYFLFFN